MVLLAGVLVLAGCGSAGNAPPAAAAGHTVDHAAGRTEVPAQVQRVVALDENAGLLLYELGAQPVEALGTASSVGVKQILIQAGIPVTPADFAVLPVEKVAVLNPDLIVGSATPGALEAYPRLSQIATTVLTGYSDPWSKQLAVGGASIGKADLAQQRTATLQTKIDDTRRELQERGIAGQSVSVLAWRWCPATGYRSTCPTRRARVRQPGEAGRLLRAAAPRRNHGSTTA
ncbi:MAG: ABC transporter substrate-binding protein [Pseudonocardia sp.]|nr:ABC transporter substrate-binding protein [Pseudonocardia sp.]